MRVLDALVAVSISLPSAAVPVHDTPQVSSEKCGVIFENASGKPESRLLPGFSVASIANDAPFVLPAHAPPKVLAVQCGRTSLVPGRNDYKVLQAGFPFSIVADDRVGVLEVVEGRVRFNMLDGEMTEAELKPIGDFLDFAQAEMNKEE